VIPPETQEVITGMLLGDSCLSMNGNDANFKVDQKD